MKLTLRGSYHTHVISHTELASHKNQRLLLFLWESIGRVFFMFQGKLWKLTQLKTPQLTCISLTTRHIRKVSTLIAKEQVEEKKISKFLEYFEYFLRELSDETFDVALSSLKCQLYWPESLYTILFTSSASVHPAYTSRMPLHSRHSTLPLLSRNSTINRKS